MVASNVSSLINPTDIETHAALNEIAIDVSIE
jgi:hypothetical protein